MLGTGPDGGTECRCGNSGSINSFREAILDTIKTEKLTEEAAMRILRAARERTKELNVLVSIAAVDDGAHLMTFRRTDGARLHTVRVAIAKARSSALTRSPRSALSQEVLASAREPEI